MKQALVQRETGGGQHQPDFIARVGDRFLLLESGRLHAFDRLSALRAAPVAHESLN